MKEFNTTGDNNTDKIIITKRQASILTASMLLLCLSVFIVGYFIGKRSVIEDFSTKVAEDSLNDQIDYLLTSQALQQENNETKQEDAFKLDDVVNQIQKEENSLKTEEKQHIQIKKEQEIPASKVQQEKMPDAKPYAAYAQLIGFGNKKTALYFAARLKRHGIEVQIKTRISKTSKGIRKTWYQAVTQVIGDKKDLYAVVDKIKRLEHIRDIDIKIIDAQKP